MRRVKGGRPIPFLCQIDGDEDVSHSRRRLLISPRATEAYFRCTGPRLLAQGSLWIRAQGCVSFKTFQMSDTISAFRSTRVLVLGDAIIDEYLSGDCSRLSPEAPVPVLRVTATRQTLGGAANTAANVASLGGLAQLIAITGADAAGEQLAALCRDAGIDLLPIQDQRPTLARRASSVNTSSWCASTSRKARPSPPRPRHVS